MPHPHLNSFVIPAGNEEAVLEPTVEAVSVAARHLVEPSEVIVADDRSTDRTAEIAHQHGAQVVTVHHRQIARTRNARARAAQGDLLINGSNWSALGSRIFSESSGPSPEKGPVGDKGIARGVGKLRRASKKVNKTQEIQTS